MKKTFLFVLFASFTTFGVAQSNKVVNAYTYHKNFNRDKDAKDLILAVENIEPATLHEKTMNEPKTWYYRGLIYTTIYDTKVDDDKINELKKSALKEAYKSFIREIELDTKKEYSKECIQRLDIIHNVLFNEGVNFYNNSQNYEQALVYYEDAIEIYTFLNKYDTLAVKYAGFAAEKANKFDKAIEFYNSLIANKGADSGTYTYLANAYKAKKDDTKALEIIKEGRLIFPNDKNLIIEELNYYLVQGKLQEAINNINLAIQNDPTNHILYFSLGTLYDNMANPDKDKKQPSEEEYNKYIAKAEESYKKAIEIKPEYFDASYNLGALYYNQGVKYNDLANKVDIKDKKGYDTFVKKADSKFTLAAPYLEKALLIQPGDRNTLESLKALYPRIGEMEKYKKVKEQLQN